MLVFSKNGFVFNCFVREILILECNNISFFDVVNHLKTMLPEFCFTKPALIKTCLYHKRSKVFAAAPTKFCYRIPKGHFYLSSLLNLALLIRTKVGHDKNFCLNRFASFIFTPHSPKHSIILLLDFTKLICFGCFQTKV